MISSINHQEIANFPTGGWHKVAESVKIKSGKIYTLHLFDHEFICIRSKDRLVKIFDAYCPHLGAHLGVGGKIVNEQLICPFHGWQYDFSGKCVAIPYCERIPKRARLESFPTKEIAGSIFMYYQVDTQSNEA